MGFAARFLMEGWSGEDIVLSCLELGFHCCWKRWFVIRFYFGFGIKICWCPFCFMWLGSIQNCAPLARISHGMLN